MLCLSNVSVKIEDKTIIKNFSYTFEENKVYVIMGPNGSGKSSLAHAILGDTRYKVQSNKLAIKNVEGDEIDLSTMSVDERARAGLFLSFQTPLSLQGVRAAQLLQIALGKEKSAVTLRREIAQFAKELHIRDELLNRSLNDGASGGERKKLEVLQAALLDKSVELYDEIDTGVDVDSLKDIGLFLHKRKKGKIYILITHYNRLLKYVRPDVVLVLVDGMLKATGDYNLANSIEQEGYDSAISN